MRRRYPLGVYLFAFGQWAAVALVLSKLDLQQHLGLVATFTAMTATFDLLKVRVGRVDTSVGALIAYINLAETAVPLAVLAKVIGMLLASLIEREQRPLPQKWFGILMNTGNLGLTVATAGWIYHLLGGPSGATQLSATMILPYLGMAFTYVLTNILLMALPRAIAEHRLPWQPALETVVRSWPNLTVFVVSGILLQTLYAQFNLVGLFFVFAILLVIRFSVQLYAERLGFRGEMVETLTRVLSFKDPYTAAHSARVAALAVQIGREMGFSELQLERLHDSALLHDIGKVAVPDAVLGKPGQLDTNEHKAMERHVGAGSELLMESPHLRELADLVGSHHAFFNLGADRGVPLESRIIAVADAFDAMTTDRPYRKALPIKEAIRRLLEARGTQFDPEVVQVLLRIIGMSPPPPGEEGAPLRIAEFGSGPASLPPPGAGRGDTDGGGPPSATLPHRRPA